MNITDNRLSPGGIGRHYFYSRRRHSENTNQLDVNDLVLRSIELFNGQRKRIVVHHRLQKHLWTVSMEGIVLEKALLNIYTNAWQAMPAGGALFIETLNRTMPNAESIVRNDYLGKDFICITVTDTGAELPVGSMDRIFDLMYHAGERGSGFGLAFVRAEIEKHAGRVEVENTLVRGTTVRLFLPAGDRAPGYPEVSHL